MRGNVQPEQAAKHVADAQQLYWTVLKSLRHRQSDYIQRSDWTRAVLCVPKFIQILTFAEQQHRFCDRDYWRMLGHIFWGCHSQSIFLELFRYLMRAPRAEWENIMTPEMLRTYEALPDTVLCFRGHAPYNADGLFYTLNVLSAMKYAAQHREQGENGTVTQRLISKRDCWYAGGTAERIIYVPGMGAIQSTMNGNDEIAKEKLREQWLDNPPKGFTTK